jgi:hypothetical protein
VGGIEMPQACQLRQRGSERSRPQHPAGLGEHNSGDQSS